MSCCQGYRYVVPFFVVDRLNATINKAWVFFSELNFTHCGKWQCYEYSELTHSYSF